MSAQSPGNVQLEKMARDWLRVAEWCVAVALTIAATVLLVVRVAHAGPLWRDECATVQLSLMPTAAQVLQNFQRESFPAFLPLLVRGYAKLTGGSDAAFRVFGLLVGLSMIAALWWNARRLTADVPILALSLLALNSSFLIWGTAVRGYGIGSVVVVVSLGAVAALLLKTNRRNVAAAAVGCICAVHLLLYNSVLLAVFALALAVVCLFTRQWRPIGIVAIVGAMALLSILPNLFAFQYESRSTVVLQGPIDLKWLWEQFSISLGDPAGLVRILWLAGLFFGLVVASALLWRGPRPSPEWRLTLFGLLTLILSLPAYFAFLEIVRYRTREWYYVALLAVLATALDLIAGAAFRWRVARYAKIAIGAFALLVVPFGVWPKLLPRQTNIDLVAHRLSMEAESNDLIICNPWYLGVSFNRYYDGKARWLTCPILGDHTVHRFDLLKAQMMAPAPLADLLDAVRETLAANHRVWVVGDLAFLKKDESPLLLSPAPDPQVGWSCDAYADAWSEQLAWFLQQHVATGGYVAVPQVGPVSELETVNLLVAQGWIGSGLH